MIQHQPTESLEEIARRLDRDYEEQKASMAEWRITTNAVLEKIDKKLDYLMKGGGGNDPNII